MSQKQLSRRDFLKFSAMSAVATLVASCAQPTQAPPAAEPTKPPAAAPAAATNTPAPPASKYKEAPALAEMVKSGTLPPVDERLPDEPMVVQPHKSIGKYGGTWRMATLGANDGAILVRTSAYEYLLRWDTMYSTFGPNLASSWEVNPQGNEIVFNLRKGVKWSDGQPLTSEDYAFTYNNVLANKTLQPRLPSWLIQAGEECQFTQVDAFTLKFAFAAPYPTFVMGCAGTGPGIALAPRPKHYMKDHHIEYADKAALDKKIKDAGYESWPEYWGSLEVYPHGRKIGRPVQWAWVPKGEDLGSSTEFIMERNPYYWKVDPEGNQLPYIDRLLYRVHEDKETMLLAAMAGEIDNQKRHIDRADALPLLKEASERQCFHFYQLDRQKMNSVILNFNQCTPTLELRPLFSNMDFRIALSYGIDRQEIIDVVYAGQGEPAQPSPLPSSPYYNEDMAKRYTEYKPDLANEMLDKIIPQKDRDGFRMLPDGSKRLLLIVETPSDFQKEWIDVLQIVQNHWAKIGVDMMIKASERSLFQTRTQYEHDMCIWEGDIDFTGLVNVPHGPGGYNETFRCWKDWFNSNGAEGEEPPQLAKDMNALYNTLLITPDLDERAKIIKQLQDMEPLWRIGTSRIPPGFGIVKNNFYNMPEIIADLWIAPCIANASPEQFWIDTDQKC